MIDASDACHCCRIILKMASIFAFLLLFSFFRCCFTNGEMIMEKAYSNLRNKLFKYYDIDVLPYEGLPINVGITMYIFGISDLDDGDKTMTFTTHFHQMWHDSRLSFSSSVWNMSSMQVLRAHTWIPDTFFVNEIQAKEDYSTGISDFTGLSSDGNIIRSQRYTLTISCPMDFSKFPMDFQICHLPIESYGYTVRDLEYQWPYEKNSVVIDNHKMNDNKFAFMGIDLGKEYVLLSTGNYSRLVVNFKFARKFGYYVLHFYVPAAVVTLFAFLSLWLSSIFITQFLLSITSLLLILLLIINSYVVTPAVPFVTPLDFYLAITTTIILSIILYHAFVANSFKYNSSGITKLLGSPSFQKIWKVTFGLLIVLFNILYWVMMMHS